MKILEFTTEAEAQTCLSVINAMASAWWVSKGYTVIDNNGTKELVGKRNGVDNTTATRTLSWDTVKESPDGTFYITSLTGTRDEWADWKQNLADSGFTAIGTEKDYPDDWVDESI